MRILTLLLSCSSPSSQAQDLQVQAAQVEPAPDPFVLSLAEGTRRWAQAPLSAEDYPNGSDVFASEWLFGTWMMAAVGLGQLITLHPSLREQNLPAMESAIAQMLSEQGRAFDNLKYGSDITSRLDEDQGSIALLGYGGLALAMHRHLDPQSRFAQTEQLWIDAIARRLEGGRLVQTYPGETYPVDNSSALAALTLHDKATGQDHQAAIQAGLAALRSAIEPRTGLLYQAYTREGQPTAPRGSGTFLSAWFLLRVDPDLSRDLYEAGVKQLYGQVIGLSAMREYPEGWPGREDIDSGPLLMGYSVSATGFAMGAAAGLGELEMRDRLVGTARTGGPLAVRMVPGLGAKDGGGATGSHLGDTMLLAMLTAAGRP